MTTRPKATPSQWVLRALALALLGAWGWYSLASLLGFLAGWAGCHALVSRELRDAYLQLGVPKAPAVEAVRRLLDGDPRALQVHVHNPQPRPTTTPPPAPAGVH